MSRSTFKSIRQRLAARHDARITDYIDFNQLSREIVAIAIDAVDTVDLHGHVVYHAGRPIAYTDMVHLADGRWIFTAKKPGDMPKARPAYVPASAIIGPLPAPSESLRVRPA